MTTKYPAIKQRKTMATYTPCLGEVRDGLCDCGQPATQEVQSGWHNGRDGQPSGGQYTELCEECYDEEMSSPAIDRLREYQYHHRSGKAITLDAEDEDEALASLREIVERDFPDTDYDEWTDA